MSDQTPTTTAIIKMYRKILEKKSTHDVIYRLNEDLKKYKKIRRKITKLDKESENYKENMRLNIAGIEAIEFLLAEYQT